MVEFSRATTTLWHTTQRAVDLVICWPSDMMTRQILPSVSRIVDGLWLSV